MKKLLAITAAMTAMLAGRVSATETLDAKYFAIDENSIVIEEIDSRGGTIPGTQVVPGGPTIPGPGELPKPPSGPQINPPINPGGGATKPPEGGTTPPVDPLTNINNTVDTLDKIVNLMEKIFAIIEKNQPVVNITTNYANAVPFGTSHWTQLQGWTRPATKKYAFSMKNAYGSEVVKVTYQVHYTYKGNFQGKGQFLTGVTVEPLNVVTAWGYKVTLVSEVPDSTIANVGTHEDPIASMQLQLRWTVHTMVKDITSKAIYYVQGDGVLQEIGTPFKNAQELKTQKKVDGVKVNVATSTFN
ncbi:MAG: hypothetical protein PHV33_02985 [Elusimicrobiales bacterium]|nr:hypothetical protein [Elusimicrobiales bacterium]